MSTGDRGGGDRGGDVLGGGSLRSALLSPKRGSSWRSSGSAHTSLNCPERSRLLGLHRHTAGSGIGISNIG